MEIHYTQILTRDTVYRIKIQPTHTAAPLPLPLPTHNSQPLTLVHDSTLWRTKPPYPFSTTVCYSIPKIKIFTFKNWFILNSINQTLIKQLKLYSVMCYCLMNAVIKFQDCTDFFFYHALNKSPSVVQLSREAICQSPKS